MPEKRFTLPFTVRTYEVDAHGQVLPATLMRWFQEAAIRHSAARGFDDARYRALGSTWWVKEFHMEILAPLAAGEVVEAVTWPAAFQRVLAFRQYRLARPDGQVVANAEARWAYIDRATGRPRRLDAEIMEGFVPEDEYALADREWGAHVLGRATPPETGVCRRQHPVLWSELDGAGHVNNAVYAAWIADHLAAASPEIGPGAIRRLRLRYERGIPAGALVESEMWRVMDGRWVYRARTTVEDSAAALAVIETA